MLKILRDAGLSDLIASADVEELASGFVFTEGPLGRPDGSLLFQDMKGQKTYRIPPGGPVELLRENTEGANGQTFGPDGDIIFCEQDGRRVSRMGLDGGGARPVVETWSGQRLNSPNDIVCRSDGLLYFTDPPYGVAPEARALHFQGVYSLDPRPMAGAPGAGRSGPSAAPALRLLLDDFEKPNGLAFSPDESVLYVCDTARYHVRAFDVEPSGGLRAASGRVFARMAPATPGGPDGLKVDRDGRVYVAVAEGVWVYEPDGRFLGVLALPARPSNLAWYGPGAHDLAITAVGSVHRVRFHVAGVVPPFSPGAGRSRPHEAQV